MIATNAGFAGAKCLLSLKDVKFFAEYSASVNGRSNMVSLITSMFQANVEGGVFEPSTGFESELESVFFYLPVTGTLQKQVKQCIGEAKGKTSEFGDTFWRMLYFSIVTIATLGYGDITPISGAARFMSGLEVVLGLTLAGLFINALFNQLSNGKRDQGLADNRCIEDLRESLSKVAPLLDESKKYVDSLEQTLAVKSASLIQEAAKCQSLSQENRDLDQRLKGRTEELSRAQQTSNEAQKRIGELEEEVKNLRAIPVTDDKP